MRLRFGLVAFLFAASFAFFVHAAEDKKAATKKTESAITAQALFQKIVDTKNWPEQKAAADQLKLLGKPALDVILKVARSEKDPYIREIGFRLLYEKFMSEESAVNTIIKSGLKDSDSTIKYNCALYLGEKKIERASDDLKQLMIKSSRDSWEFMAAAKSLAELGDKSIARQLYFGLTSDWALMRQMASQGFKALVGKEVTDFGGYDWKEGAYFSGGGEWRTAIDTCQDSKNKAARYTAISSLCEWIKKERPDVYKAM